MTQWLLYWLTVRIFRFRYAVVCVEPDGEESELCRWPTLFMAVESAAAVQASEQRCAEHYDGSRYRAVDTWGDDSW